MAKPSKIERRYEKRRDQQPIKDAQLKAWLDKILGR